jgi:hypothetical protein
MNLEIFLRTESFLSNWLALLSFPSNCLVFF